ncbi:uncharacterized protein LOC123516203 isoform X1 [Portunus trituberculatus]|uniref:uncharacterized protein LOC123516203 isoform X1 n=1 Tax=Portunus trituberculatus TaxID=210409 RepID=UPI001E1CEF7B|nr:uncharacterized protein LOC123516203 isoform X1 [Portunus trituberculatus]
MGLSHRIAFRLYAANFYAKRLHSLPPVAASFLLIGKGRNRCPQRQRHPLIAATLLFLLVLPWTLTQQQGQQAALLMAALSVITVLLICGLQTTAAIPPELGDGWWTRLSDNWWWQEFLPQVLLRMKRRFLNFESAYLKLKNFSLLINQLVFFTMCERLLMEQQKLTSLYTLMFFNVIIYCVAYVKEVVEREDWTMYVNIARTSNVRHLALSTTKMVLEWTKAVTFIITVVFLLLVMGLEKGLKDYAPTPGYLILTGVYFLVTEKFSTKIVGTWFDNKKFEPFEGMECLYWPTLLLASHLTLSTLLTLLCVSTFNFRLVLLSSFTNLRVKYRELRDDCIKPLQHELATLSSYRPANRSEVRRHDDVCAVCLAPMSSARVTPCYHLFHGDCLRRCLKESNKCPICQYHL